MTAREVPAPEGAQAGAEPPHCAGVGPLGLAARAGNLAGVRQLLAAGADPCAVDDVGETPLFEAAASGNASAVAELLLAGGDARVRSACGGLASDGSSCEHVRALLLAASGQEAGDLRLEAALAALEPDLREPMLGYIARCRAPVPAAEAEDAGQPGDGVQVQAEQRGGRTLAQATGPTLPEMEVAVTHVIQGGEMRLAVSSGATFSDLKQAIVERLGGASPRPEGVYLVRKGKGAYLSYKDSDPLGDVREVCIVGASLPPAAGP